MVSTLEDVVNDLEIGEHFAIGNQTFVSERITDYSLECGVFGTVNFWGIEFRNLDFSASTFVHCGFKNCKFYDCKFQKSDFSDSTFENCRMEHCHFTKATFHTFKSMSRGKKRN